MPHPAAQFRLDQSYRFVGAKANEGKKHYREAELAFEQSTRPLVQKQWTYSGKDDEQNLEKTVISERDQRLSLESVKVRERINDKIERSGWGRSANGAQASKAPTSGRGVEQADDPPGSTLTAGQGFDSEGPTKLERLLSSGRSMPAARRRRLEGLAARRREHSESIPAGTSSG